MFLALVVQVTVYVSDINDNPPVFAKNEYSYSISEGSWTGTVVATLTATDRDLAVNSQVIYEIITDGNCCYYCNVLSNESMIILS